MPRKLLPSPLCPSEKVTEDQLATDQVIHDLDQTIHSVNRRSFFSSITAMGAAAAAAAFLAASPKAEAQSAPAGPSIVDVLNFALNLEYLEANLYIAASGSAPLPYGVGGGGSVTGAPRRINFTDQVTQATFENLALDELHHIEVLRGILFQMGAIPVNEPVIDYTLGGKMHITTQAQLLAVARQFTAVGISAYAGAADYLISNALVLTGAAQILGAEAQHLGGLGVLCALQGVVSPMVDALDYPPMPPNTYFTLTPDTLPPLQGPSLGPVRTPQQVLGIVYGVSTGTTTTPPAGITKGGFFPQGVNGPIHST